MEIQQLGGFLAVARYLSFTVAAKKTFRSQPTISLQIKALEDELGTKLFERLGPKKVVLTEDGKVFLDLLQPVMEHFLSLKERFEEARGTLTAKYVSIATHESVMLHFLPQIIETFKTSYPECQLRIFDRDREKILKMVINGDVDIGITSIEKIPREVEYSVFARFKRVLIAPKDHSLAKRRSITAQELAKHPLILTLPGSSTRRAVDELFAKHHLESFAKVEVMSSEVIKTYVAMGLGVGIVNEYDIEPGDEKSLHIRILGKLFGQSESGIVVKKNRPFPKEVLELKRIIETSK